MDLSIIIPVRNGKAHLERCLPSLFAQEAPPSFEVILVDNDSRDGTRSWVQDTYPTLCLIAQEKNSGFARAVNRGLRVAQGRYLLCLNQDTWLFPEALATLVDFMDRTHEAGIVGGKIFNPDHSLQFSCRTFPTLSQGLFHRGSLLTRLSPKNRFSRNYLLSDWPHDEVRSVDWVSGAFLLIRRETFEEIGPLDERFFLYCEDVDWCRRAKEAGWQVLYYPKSRILHSGGLSYSSLRALFEHHRSMWRYYLKYLKRDSRLGALFLIGISLRFLSLCPTVFFQHYGRRSRSLQHP